MMTNPLKFGIIRLVWWDGGGRGAGSARRFRADRASGVELTAGRHCCEHLMLLYRAESVEGIYSIVEILVKIGIPWDFVLCFPSVSGEPEDWTGPLRRLLRGSDRQTGRLQITNEPNLKGVLDAADGKSFIRFG